MKILPVALPILKIREGSSRTELCAPTGTYPNFLWEEVDWTLKRGGAEEKRGGRGEGGRRGERFVGNPQVKPRTEVLVGPSGGTPYRLEDLVGLDPHQSPWGGDIQCQIGSVRQDDLAPLADREIGRASLRERV